MKAKVRLAYHVPSHYSGVLQDINICVAGH